MDYYTDIYTNLKLYAPICLKIKTIRGTLEPFKFNDSQKYLHKKLEQQLRQEGMIRAIVLKGRKQGCSTYVGARYFFHTANNSYRHAYVMAHNTATTKELFSMTVRFYENCPLILRPSVPRSSRTGLFFDRLDSQYSIGTAGGKEIGRGFTINYVHGSEVAFWENGDDVAAALLEAVPVSQGTEIILESTANGIDNFFYSKWRDAVNGKSDYIPIFLPWYWHKANYREPKEKFSPTKEEEEFKRIYKLSDGQLYWRRQKIVELNSNSKNGEWNFKREYPFTAAEAFATSTVDGLIPELKIIRARKTTVEENHREKLILGVDVARFGDDSSVLIFRQGRRAFGLKVFNKIDNMELAAIIDRTLREYQQIWAVKIDMGGGQGVYDRLLELGHGHRVHGVNFGEAATESELYVNRRAECYWNMRRWFLKNDSVEIPDDDELHVELSAQDYKYQSERKIQMIKKEEIKKRIGRSPDKSDALALTFDFSIDFSSFI